MKTHTGARFRQTGLASALGYPIECYGSEFHPADAVGPQTAHVMWTKPIQGGGVVGGNSFVNAGRYILRRIGIRSKIHQSDNN